MKTIIKCENINEFYESVSHFEKLGHRWNFDAIHESIIKNYINCGYSYPVYLYVNDNSKCFSWDIFRKGEGRFIHSKEVDMVIPGYQFCRSNKIKEILEYDNKTNSNIVQ